MFGWFHCWNPARAHRSAHACSPSRGDFAVAPAPRVAWAAGPATARPNRRVRVEHATGTSAGRRRPRPRSPDPPLGRKELRGPSRRIVAGSEPARCSRRGRKASIASGPGADGRRRRGGRNRGPIAEVQRPPPPPGAVKQQARHQRAPARASSRPGSRSRRDFARRIQDGGPGGKTGRGGEAVPVRRRPVRARDATARSGERTGPCELPAGAPHAPHSPWKVPNVPRTPCNPTWRAVSENSEDRARTERPTRRRDRGFSHRLPCGARSRTAPRAPGAYCSFISNLTSRPGPGRP